MMRDHGGDMDAAVARFGAGDWLDLSTGINRRPYPLPAAPPEAWRALPTRAAQAELVAAAASAWGAAPGLDGIALAGAQAAIQLVPHLLPPGRAHVLSPSYNEHAACLRAAGWELRDCPDAVQLRGADLAVLVNPNNPDGRSWGAQQVLDLSREVGLLVVDESFADAVPGLTVLPRAGEAENLLVLRSFGKFYGLAGLRLGFAFGAPAQIAAIRARAGPWPVSGPAIEIGRRALADRAWADAMCRQLAGDAVRLDELAAAAGWGLVGGTPLFRVYGVPAAAAQEHLARHHIWSRVFPYAAQWLRLGLPGPEAEWARLGAALAAWPHA